MADKYVKKNIKFTQLQILILIYLSTFSISTHKYDVMYK